MSRIDVALARLDGYNQRNGDEVLTLRQVRQSLGMSIRDVERETGFSRATLSKIERGLENAKMNVILSLCDYYGLPLDSVESRHLWFTTARPHGLELSPQEGDDDAADTETRVA